MSSISTKFSQLQHKITFSYDKNVSALYKPLVLTSIFFFLVYILLSDGHIYQAPQYLDKFRQGIGFPRLYDSYNDTIKSNNPTNISHIIIGIAGSVQSWKFRKSYIESWWQPNVTKGYLFLDQEPTGELLPWPTASPPYRISEDTSRYQPYNKHLMPHAIRMVRVIAETFRLANEGVRWYVMADDDTIFFLDNLVDVLSRYDHNKYFYIGGNSESVTSNFDNSFAMAFGGGGYAISYPLAEALTKNLDVCIKRYPFLYGSDHIMQSCVADLGVSLTHEKGFHQIDLHRDLSGFLSSHPQTPLVSLHHLDFVDPLFPFMSKFDALRHLIEAAKVDEARLLQQTMCYEKSKKWSFSIALGYSIQVYEKFIPPSVLEKPLETFSAWIKPPKQPFMFNTRFISNHPCEVPHFFFLESINKSSEENHVVSSYTRRSPPRTLEACPASSSSNNGSIHARIRELTKIIVFSPAAKYSAMAGTRRECCDILDQVEKNVTMIKYRTCIKNEILGVDD